MAKFSHKLALSACHSLIMEAKANITSGDVMLAKQASATLILADISLTMLSAVDSKNYNAIRQITPNNVIKMDDVEIVEETETETTIQMTV